MAQLIIPIFLLSCGGGGGGGDSGGGDSGGSGGSEPTDPDTNEPSIFTPQPDYPYPKLHEDPDYIGDVIGFDGSRFSITSKVNGKTLELVPNGRNSNAYFFDEGLKFEGNSLYPLAASNADVVLVSTIIGDNPATRYGMFGIDGERSQTVPDKQIAVYHGLYQSRSVDGTLNPTYPMRIELDLHNIQDSQGSDLIDGQHVRINFNVRQGSHISGNIRDDNHVTNAGVFGLYGANARSLAGGYNSPVGTGLLLVERE